MLENHLYSLEGVFNVSLQEYDDIEIIDQSDFGNKISFERTRITVVFGDYFGNEINDFSVDVTGSRGLSIKCLNGDSRALRLTFKKGEEEPVTQSILRGSKGYIAQFGKSLGSSIWDDFDQSKLEEEGSESKGSEINRKIGLADSNPFLLLETDESEYEEGELNQVVLRFETRYLRDLFLISMRFMRIKRSLPMVDVLNNFNLHVKESWFPSDQSIRAHEYFQIVYEMDQLKGVIQNMMNAQKALRHENDSLNEGLDILEGDLEFSVKEIGGLIAALQKKKGFLSVSKYKEVEKSLLNRSVQLGRMRGKNTPKSSTWKKQIVGVDGVELKKMEKELESRKMLNEMLLKEIDKLKVKNSEEKRRQEEVEKSFIGGPTPEKDIRMSRSVLGNLVSSNVYLMNAEEGIKQEARFLEEEYEKMIEKEKEEERLKKEVEEKEVRKLNKEIECLKERLSIQENVFQEMLELADRVNHGEKIEDIPELLELLKDITVGVSTRLDSIPYAQLKEYNQFLNDKIKEITANIGNGELSEAGEENPREQAESLGMGASEWVEAKSELEEEKQKSEKLTEEKNIREKAMNQNQKKLSELVTMNKNRGAIFQRMTELEVQLKILRQENESMKNLGTKEVNNVKDEDSLSFGDEEEEDGQKEWTPFDQSMIGKKESTPFDESILGEKEEKEVTPFDESIMAVEKQEGGGEVLEPQMPGGEEDEESLDLGEESLDLGDDDEEEEVGEVENDGVQVSGEVEGKDEEGEDGDDQAEKIEIEAVGEEQGDQNDADQNEVDPNLEEEQIVEEEGSNEKNEKEVNPVVEGEIDIDPNVEPQEIEIDVEQEPETNLNSEPQEKEEEQEIDPQPENQETEEPQAQEFEETEEPQEPREPQQPEQPQEPQETNPEEPQEPQGIALDSPQPEEDGEALSLSLSDEDA